MENCANYNAVQEEQSTKKYNFPFFGGHPMHVKEDKYKIQYMLVQYLLHKFIDFQYTQI